ncbi:MAG: mechanosensitive ion channel domain-containing protein, partial [Pseudomonadota bacterium]
AGVALAGLFAVSAAGIDLTQLAFVAGALSLGIGFGLQNIVNNFVSGLILLAERPFKAGDIIEAGGFTGTVNKVNVRATEITTFDRKTLILPNSELINGTVTNWIHKSTLGRIQVPVGVSYDSDAKQVHDILLEIANDHPRVLSNPEPFVSFDNFGDSSLDFVLYAYLADIGFGLTVRTELRMAILERFRAANIEIPFPQRDINIRQAAASAAVPVDPDTDFGVIDTAKTRQIDDD